jgi:hypothetical protein
MAFANAKMAKAVTLTTAGGTAAAKVAACLPALLDVILDEIGEGVTLTPRAQNKLATLRADLVSNAATMQTALGL